MEFSFNRNGLRYRESRVTIWQYVELPGIEKVVPQPNADRGVFLALCRTGLYRVNFGVASARAVKIADRDDVRDLELSEKNYAAYALSPPLIETLPPLADLDNDDDWERTVKRSTMNVALPPLVEKNQIISEAEALKRLKFDPKAFELAMNRIKDRPSIQSNAQPSRLDVLYGVGTLRPSLKISGVVPKSRPVLVLDVQRAYFED